MHTHSVLLSAIRVSGMDRSPLLVVAADIASLHAWYVPQAGAAGAADTNLLLRDVDARLGAHEASLVKCLLLRASFGGMAGDVQMLRGSAAAWAARFAGVAGEALTVRARPPTRAFACHWLEVRQPGGPASLR